MPAVRGKCTRCGTPINVEVAEVFADAEVVGALCPGCTDQQFLDGGGMVFALRREPDGARFPLGKITVTPGALEALAESGQHAAAFLLPHVRGQWGAFGDFEQIELNEDERHRGWEVTDDSAKINKSNLLNQRDEIMSEYGTAAGQRLWVITRLDRGGGTTLLLPEEY